MSDKSYINGKWIFTNPQLLAKVLNYSFRRSLEIHQKLGVKIRNTNAIFCVQVLQHWQRWSSLVPQFETYIVTAYEKLNQVYYYFSGYFFVSKWYTLGFLFGCFWIWRIMILCSIKICINILPIERNIHISIIL